MCNVLDQEWGYRIMGTVSKHKVEAHTRARARTRTHILIGSESNKALTSVEVNSIFVWPKAKEYSERKIIFSKTLSEGWLLLLSRPKNR